MKKFKYIFIGLFFIVSSYSCKKTDYVQYQENLTRLQFGPASTLIYNSSYIFSDTLKRQSFAYIADNISIDTVYFDIYTMGNLSDKDRVYTLIQEQVAGEENAVPGLHYKSFDDSQIAGLYVIKAGQAHNRVPVILYRDLSLKTKSVLLKFNIKENENFKSGQSNLLWRKLIFTDNLAQPSIWNAGLYIWGSYSEVKHRFMISVTGQKWDDEFLLRIKGDVQEQSYWMGMVKSALVAYNNAHPGNELRDEFGQLVVIP